MVAVIKAQLGTGVAAGFVGYCGCFKSTGRYGFCCDGLCITPEYLLSYISQLEDSGVYWQFAGSVDTEQLILAFNGFYGRKGFSNTRYQIRDYRQVNASDADIDVEGIAKVAAYDLAAARSNPRMRVALVIAPHEMSETLAYLYEAETLASEWKYRVFTNLDTARVWCRQPSVTYTPALQTTA